MVCNPVPLLPSWVLPLHPGRKPCWGLPFQARYPLCSYISICQTGVIVFMVMRGPQDTVRKHAHGSEDVHLGIHKIRMALALSSCGSRRIYKLGEADSYFANIKLKHARLAGRLALLWGLESVPRFGEREPAKAVPLQATCPPSPGCPPPRTTRQKRWEGNIAQRLFLDPTH